MNGFGTRYLIRRGAASGSFGDCKSNHQPGRRVSLAFSFSLVLQHFSRNAGGCPMSARAELGSSVYARTLLQQLPTISSVLAVLNDSSNSK